MLSPNRDEVALGIEDVHLDEAVVVRRRRRPVDDEEDEVVVLLELRALAELLRVLERERVEAEDVAEEREIFRPRRRSRSSQKNSPLERRDSIAAVSTSSCVAPSRSRSVGRHGSPVTLTPLDTL